MQEVRNAVDQARPLGTLERYDFKGTDSSIDLAEEGGAQIIRFFSPRPRPKVKDSVKVLEEKLVKRKVALKALTHGKIEQAAGGTSRQALTLNQGIANGRRPRRSSRS